MTFQASPKEEQEPPLADLEEIKIEEGGAIHRNKEISVMHTSVQRAKGVEELNKGEFGYNAARKAVEAIRAREAQEQLIDLKADENEQEPEKPMLNMFRSHNYYEVSPKNSELQRGMNRYSSQVEEFALAASKRNLEVDPDLCSLDSHYEMVSDLFDYQ